MYNMINLEKIKDLLGRFQLTPTECEVYLSLLQLQQANGSQVAKESGLSRSSVYSALSTLHQRGLVYSIPGEPTEYLCEDPDHIFSRMGREYMEAAEILQEQLKDFRTEDKNQAFVNLKGSQTNVEKARQLVAQATQELLLNLAGELDLLRDDLVKAADRGVKVYLFSFSDIQLDHPGIKVFSHGEPCKADSEFRIMLVADMETAFLYSGREAETIGTVTHNRLMVSVAAEHIHHDIYLLKWKREAGGDPVAPRHLIGSLMEKRRLS